MTNKVNGWFPQDIKGARRQGNWDPNMMGQWCWVLRSIHAHCMYTVCPDSLSKVGETS